jgi:hypothetical protein
MFLTINGVIVIDWLPPGEKFSNGYFCEQMLEPPSEILHSRRAVRSARSILYFDNAAPHRSAVTENCFEGCQFQHSPQPPQSHNIRPRDFFRFGDLKTKLKSEEFETMEELQRKSEEPLGQVTSGTLQRLY